MRTAHWIAMVGAVAVFLAAIVLAKMRSWPPFAISAFVYVALFLIFLPKRQTDDRPPAGPERSDHQNAMAELARGAAQLRASSRQAPAADVPLFERMAELLDAIAGHLRANPDHVTRTRRLVRHALPRILGSIDQYIGLLQRSGPDAEDRLAEVSRQLEAFVPALERVDRACLDNDLTELEISVDVLTTQLERR